MATGLETLIGATFFSIFGNPLILGLFVVFFFVILALSLRMGFELMFLIIIPGIAVAAAITELMFLKVILAVVIGFIFMLAVMKVMRR